MVTRLLKKVVGTKNDRELRRMRKVVSRINAHEEAMQALSDEQLRGLTTTLKGRFAAGETLDALLPEAFAAVREAARRTLGLRHFDVQMIGGISLHEGKIAEMRTGEGKTLVATLAIYLNALADEGVHLVTVNDYLARRDAQWMGPVYAALGMSVGVIQSFAGMGVANSFIFEVDAQPDVESYRHMRPVDRRDAYAADITYGTNNEFGFDYLRDNMALRLEDKSQRNLYFAIVDEVDSILIDEARTPLIISGAARDSSDLYRRVNDLIKALERQPEGMEDEVTPGDFSVDEKHRQIELSEAGHQKVEELLIRDGLLPEGESVYQAANLNLLHHVHAALKAHYLFHRDVEYIVQDEQVVLIDEHTGRTMAGRRLSEGLHQAIEAKEGLKIQQESQTLASTTFQNYFRIYNKLAGMTGTADTEAYEFQQIYGLQVVVIPTNRSIQRRDLNDLVYLSQQEKLDAVIEYIQALNAMGAPILVGTASVENSELLARLMQKAKVPHNVLNAKHHEREAHIVAGAGRLGAVTVATNMAGRGTDIQLQSFEFEELLAHWQAHEIAPRTANASDPELFTKLTDFWVEKFLDDKTRQKLGSGLEERQKALRSYWESVGLTPLPFQPVTSTSDLGGLHIIGTERHESRRIDNQLRGRSGRQGDPGMSRFFMSMEDPLMRLFASDRVKNMMRAIGMQQGEAIEHRMVTNAIEKAQRKVEGRNFDIRKQLLEYDDVANDQRKVIYQQRNELLEATDISDVIENIFADVADTVVSNYVPPQSLVEMWDIAGLEGELSSEFGQDLPITQWMDEDKRLAEEGIRDRIRTAFWQAYQEKSESVGPDMRVIEKQIMLQVLDNLWKDHLASMDALRQGIGLRAYAQRNPKQEYKRESFELFEQLLESVKYDTVRFLCRIEVRQQSDAETMEQRRLEEQRRQEMSFKHEDAAGLAAPEQGGATPGGDRQLAGAAQPFVREEEKVGRNEPCPCGSGKKYKQCHGRLS